MVKVPLRAGQRISMEKYRHEFKYEMDYGTAVTIESKLSVLMKKDPHAGDKGMYTIRSLYFDDCDDSCFYDNEDGVNPREKYRIRIYNQDPSFITLEVKRKENEKTQKRTEQISVSFCEKILSGKRIPYEDTQDSPLLRKFWIAQETRMLHPVLLVEYERIPFVYPDGNVRITVDQNMRGGTAWEEFFKKDTCFRPVMPVGRMLLEVKYDEFLPDAIFHAASSRNLKRVTYSKYYLCRKFSGGMV